MRRLARVRDEFTKGSNAQALQHVNLLINEYPGYLDAYVLRGDINANPRACQKPALDHYNFVLNNHPVTAQKWAVIGQWLLYMITISTISPMRSVCIRPILILN